MTLSYSMENVSSIFMKHCLIAEINWWMWDCSRVWNKWLKCDIPWSFHIRDSEFQICGFKISPTTTDHDIFGRESAVTQFENLLTDQKKKFKHIRNEKKISKKQMILQLILRTKKLGHFFSLSISSEALSKVDS